jgi:hypothetical protein
MATTYSTSLKLTLIGDSLEAGTWGQTTNTNLGTLLEQAITGYVAIDMADANVTLTNLNGTSDQARNAVIRLFGTNSAVRDVIPPVVEKLYTIYNNTTGGYAIRVIGATGTGVTIPNGVTTLVYCDGTNFVNGFSGAIGNFSVAGTTTLSGALTYGGVALSNSVTGTGSMVLSASPTFTGAPISTTASPGTNTTQIATPAFATGAVSTAIAALGTMSTQNANAVTITGGSITGITDLAVADGGTGASTLAANAVLLGNGTSALQTVAPSTSGNLLVSNGTTWTSTTLASSGIKLGLGITGEVWNNVTGSRSSGASYTNSNSYPISICVSTGPGTGQSVVIVVGGVTVSNQTGGGSGYIQTVMGTAIVPAGATYSVTYTGASPLWTELY